MRPQVSYFQAGLFTIFRVFGLTRPRNEPKSTFQLRRLFYSATDLRTFCFHGSSNCLQILSKRNNNSINHSRALSSCQLRIYHFFILFDLEPVNASLKCFLPAYIMVLQSDLTLNYKVKGLSHWVANSTNACTGVPLLSIARSH